MQDHAPRDRARRDAKPTSASLTHAGVGIQFALTFLVFGALGWWLDERLGTSPLCLIGGIAVGAAGGMYSLVRRLSPGRAAPKPEARDEAEAEDAPPRDPRAR